MVEDLNSIFTFFTLKNHFNEEDEANFRKYFHPENFKKNEIILNAGEICHKIYFIKKGLLRTYHTKENGTEFTRLIAKDFDFCTILISFSEKISSPANIQALEDSELFSINKTDFQEFTKQSENAKIIYTKILEDFQNFQLKRIEFLTSHAPKEKVKLFLNENKDLERRLSDKIIATYLQISPETYSRCKKSLLS